MEEEPLNKKEIVLKQIDDKIKEVTDKLGKNELYEKLMRLQNSDKKKDEIIRYQYNIIKGKPKTVVKEENKIGKEMSIYYHAIKTAYVRLEQCNKDDPESKKKQEIITQLITRGKTNIYGKEYDTFRDIKHDNKSGNIIGEMLASTKFVNDMDENFFKDNYVYLFFNKENPTQMKYLIEDILGAVRVYVKLRMNLVNKFIEITNSLIILKLGKNDSDRKEIQVNCFDKIIPPLYESGTKPSSGNQELNGTNLYLWKILESTINLAPNKYNIAIFGSGYSGSGKSFTLLVGDNNVISSVYNNFIKDGYKITLYIFEQYGYYDIRNSKIASIFDFSQREKVFYEEFGSYYYDGSNIQYKSITDFNQFKNWMRKYSINITSRGSIENIEKDVKLHKIKNGRIKFTINNPESSRSHTYYLLNIEKGNNFGYVTIIDMGGQENPKEIFMDYMGGDMKLFKEYFGLLYLNEQKEKERVSPFGDQFVKKKQSTVEDFFKYIYKNINIIEEENQTLKKKKSKIKPTELDQAFPGFYTVKESYRDDYEFLWFYLSFYYPSELFLLERFFFLDYDFTTIKNIIIKNDGTIKSAEQIFQNLGTHYPLRYCYLTLIRQKMENFINYIKESYQIAVEKNQIEDIYPGMKGTEKEVTIEIIRNLFKSFLEGFYINETLVEKIDYLKKNQGIKEKDNKLSGNIYMDSYNPSLKIQKGNITGTQNIFENILMKIGDESIPAKFIEIACIRGDEAGKNIQPIQNISISEGCQKMLQNDGYDINSTTNVEGYEYKFVKASCDILSISSKMAAAQCLIQCEGLQTNEYYHHKYKKYKYRYIILKNHYLY
jgi:hypothetical protein